MSDDKGNTRHDSRAVALSEDHERRNFIEEFVKDHPDTNAEEVRGALDAAAKSIAPSESRKDLTAAIEKNLKLQSHKG